MATGVIRNFHIQAPTPAYFPTFLASQRDKDEGCQLREKPQEREDDDDDQEEEEEDDEEEDECLEPFVLNPAQTAVDVTNQLLRFAELINRDVQRYFGRCCEDQEACDMYDDSISMVTSGRLRYYDDLLRIAGAGTPEGPANGPEAPDDRPGLSVSKGSSGLGPLAELFNHRVLSQVRGQPMIHRHLPLSFWTEPVPRCPLVGFGGPPDVTQASGSTEADRHAHCNPLPHHSITTSELDFSDLLAYWDPNPEFPHALMEDVHAEMSVQQLPGAGI
ncbi:protein PERCC1 [Fundulus diaphanus]